MVAVHCSSGWSLVQDEVKVLKKMFIRYSGDAYSFQCGMQLLMLGENVMV